MGSSVVGDIEGISEVGFRDGDTVGWSVVGFFVGSSVDGDTEG